MILVFGSSKELSHFNLKNVRVGESVIHISESAVNIGVTLDSKLTMAKHVNKIVSSAWYHLNNIRRIRKYLTKSATETIVHAFITSRLDMCNSILYGLPKKIKNKLQSIQNKCASLVVNGRKHTSSEEIRKSLHWLPIEERITYKILVITFKCLNGTGPQYLADLISVHNCNRVLRPRGIELNYSKYKNKTHGGRSFKSAAPILWNKLPQTVRASTTQEQFKRKLKSHLFEKAYN